MATIVAVIASTHHPLPLGFQLEYVRRLQHFTLP